VVLEAGEIVEEGTHESLLARQGRYHSLWQRQAAEAEEEAV
jgi:ATP-binding cassette subfamily B protein